jgi:hypothetical protein
MTNVRNRSRDLKTRKKQTYGELSPQINGRDEDVTYPFSTGFTLFSAALVVGYMDNDGELIEAEAERRFNSEDEDSDEEDDEDGESAEDESSDDSSESEDYGADEEEDPYHRFTTMQGVLENNPDHAYTIELIDRVIAIELASHSDDENQEIPENVWNLVVAHADEGVETIKQQWDNQDKIELDNYFDELEDFWQDKLEDVSDDLTQIPTREDDGVMQTDD